jgi:ABC-type glycerol-3-phosphate transport system permease component
MVHLRVASEQLCTVGNRNGRGSAVRRSRTRALQLVGRAVLYLALIVSSAVMLVPFYWMVSTSLKLEADVFASPPEWIPQPATLVHYVQVWTRLPFARFFYNSVLVAAMLTASNAFFATLAGYAFAKLEFPGRDAIFFALLMTLMVPFQVNLIPLYKLMDTFKWLDTYWALVAPGATSILGIYLMRQFILSLPDELLDSARVDGCSEFGIFWRIVAPLSLPGVATLAIFSFVGSWTDFLWPMIVTSSMEMRTLPVGIALLQEYHTVNWTQTMAGSTIAALPMIVVFLLMQRQFIEGLTAGAVKQ